MLKYSKNNINKNLNLIDSFDEINKNINANKSNNKNLSRKVACNSKKSSNRNE